VPIGWRIFCWVVSIPAAALGFILGVVGGSTIWQHFGGASGTAYVWAVALGTILGTLFGTLIVPPDQRKLASRGFVGIVIGCATILLIASVIGHTFKAANASDVLGGLLGGAMILRAFQRHAVKSKLYSS
jgi:hypothetical protein